MKGNSNIKMLSVYYSAQNLYKDDLSAPLLNAIQPYLKVDEHDYGLLVDKALPFFGRKIGYKSLLRRIEKNFSRIDSGEINPTVFLGHDMRVNEIIEHAKRHDTYKMLYGMFFKILHSKKYSCAETVRKQFLLRVTKYCNKLNNKEKAMLQNAFTNKRRRLPLSVSMGMQQVLLDIMHDCVSEYCGVKIADKVLAQSVKKVTKMDLEYDVRNFLQVGQQQFIGQGMIDRPPSTAII